MPPLDEDALLLVLFAFTVAVVSLLLLLQAYMVCVLKRAAPHSRLPTRSTAVATAGGAGPEPGADAPTWVASLPGGSCGWVGDEEAGDCVVCLSALGEEEGGGVRVLPRCKHAFHAGCIGRWLVSHSVCCPICRTPARPEPPAASAAAAVTCPPRPPHPPLLAAETGRGDEQATGGVGGAMGGYLAQRGAVLLGEPLQVTEELHLPLLLLY